MNKDIKIKRTNKKKVKRPRQKECMNKESKKYEKSRMRMEGEKNEKKDEELKRRKKVNN